MRRVLQEDISYKSYALGHGPFLSEATKIRQAEKAEKLLAKIKEPTIPQTCFFQMRKFLTRTKNSEQEE